jgi:hypothetical protein
MTRFQTWLSSMELEEQTFKEEIEDQGFAVDVFRVAYNTGVLGVDIGVGDEAYLRTITVRIEEARSRSAMQYIYGFTTDTDVRENDHWRFRDRNDWEQFYKVTYVAKYPYGSICNLEIGK